MVDEFREESDFLGELRIPAGVGWGIATARAAQNSGIGFAALGDTPDLLNALLVVKQAAALANRDLNTVETAVAQAIADAAGSLIAEARPAEFPIEIVQGGGGTALNMNVNEVLARHAGRRLPGGHVHAIDHVNRCQSTNDVFPTAANVATLTAIDRVIPALERSAAALERIAVRYVGLDRLGRSCLVDAVPLPISAGHRAHAFALRRSIDALRIASTALLQVPLGGTAVGTGLGAVDGFGERAVAHLAELTGRDFSEASDRFDGIASLEPVANVMTALAASARVLARIAGDLRLLAAGPVGGAGEVILPTLQAGSSIMPGKVNPVLPELVMQASFRIAGAAQTVTMAAGAAELDVTSMGPVAIEETLMSARLLERVADLFTTRCLDGLEWRMERVTANISGSFHTAVELAALNGYDAASTALAVRVSDGAS